MYRGLVLRMRIYREATNTALPGGHWGYEVNVEDVHRGTRILGPFGQWSPYGSYDAAELACLQRGRIAIDMLLGPLQA